MTVDKLQMKVFCRFAPLTPTDDRQPSASAALHITCDDADASSGSSTLTLVDPTTLACMSVGCTGAFLPHPPAAQQSDLFARVALPLLDEVMRGTHCALLAYGQTSTGKTHTMFGPDGGSVKYFHAVDSRGIVPRVAEELFADHRSTAFVELAFYEIYNETVTDMVAKLCAMPEGKGTFAAGRLSCSSSSNGGSAQVLYKPTEKGRLRRSLQRVVCRNGAQCLQALGELAAIRHVSSTEHNLKSSRSHIIIEMHVYPRHAASLEPTSGGGTPGLLTLVDLAGSECLRHAATGGGGGSSFSQFQQSASAGLGRSFSTASSMPSTFTQYDDTTGEPLARQHAKRTVEMKNINTSLFALKKVVHALHSKLEHIPFKDSVLTVVLEGCLQNPATATLVVCLSARQVDLAETLASLRFASEASKITPSNAVVKRQMQAALAHSRRAAPQTELRRQDEFDASPVSHSAVVLAVPEPGCRAGGGSDPKKDPSLNETVAPSAQCHMPPSLCAMQVAVTSSIQSVHDLLLHSGLGSRNSGSASTEDDDDAEKIRLQRQLSEATQEIETSKAYAHRLMTQCNRLAQSYDSLVAELEASRQLTRRQEKELASLRIEVHLLRNEQALHASTSHGQHQQSSGATPPSAASRRPLASALKDTTNSHSRSAGCGREKPSQEPQAASSSSSDYGKNDVKRSSAGDLKSNARPLWVVEEPISLDPAVVDGSPSPVRGSRPALVPELVTSPGALRKPTSYF